MQRCRGAGFWPTTATSAITGVKAIKDAMFWSVENG